MKNTQNKNIIPKSKAYIKSENFINTLIENNENTKDYKAIKDKNPTKTKDVFIF